jgi:hypothetical protein
LFTIAQQQQQQQLEFAAIYKENTSTFIAGSFW